MNHIYLGENQMDIFSILSKMRSEVAIFSAFASFGFRKDEVLDLLTAPLVDSSIADLTWGPSFEFDTKDVIWWNNLEKDKRYFRFPSDIYSVIFLKLNLDYDAKLSWSIDLHS
jgi:UDP-glucose:glycoprotein glucosyltransferase